MAQHDYNIANQTFPNTRTDINNALSAVASNNSGTAAPSTTFANQWFYETDTNLLQIRNEDNDAYITIAELDQTNDTVEYFKSDSIRTALIEFTDGDDAITIADGGGITISTSLDMNGTELILDADANTSIQADTDNQIDFKAGGTDIMSLTATTATFNDGVTISVADNSDNLTLTSTDADGSTGPNLRLYRNSSSPADGDDLSTIDFEGRNDNSQDVVYAQIKGLITDASDGTEDGKLEFYHMLNGSTAPSLQLTSTEVVINESSNDIDFRVESNSNTKLLVADAGDNGVYVGSSGNTAPAESSTATHTFIPANGRMQISASSHPAITTNRVNSEGITVEFRQAGGVRGSISVGGASTAFNTSSDYRLKENVNYTWDGTTILKQLKPAKFNWKVDPDNTVHGFLAHEAQAVVPDSVIGEKDAVDDNGDVAPQQIDQSKLVPILVKTVQELEARIKALEDA